MKRFSCACGQAIFFDNTACLRCGARLGFDPGRLEMLAIKQTGSDTWSDDAGAAFRLCANGAEHDNCNWLVPAADPDVYCVSCRLNRTIPSLADDDNRRHWKTIEAAKRRLIYSLLWLELPVRSQVRGWPHGLAFDFVEDQRSNPDVSEAYVLTHHASGIITLNIAEAADIVRARMQAQMNERYRTLLGHFRHESGHYYFQQLVAGEPAITRFRALFGDEREDYDAAVQRHYRDGPQANWSLRHISAYAAMHPAEDWAETWAHYLHMLDCLETAGGYHLTPPLTGEFDVMLDEWSSFSVALNDVNRSLGLPDAYPFVVCEPVAAKLRFVHEALPGAVSGAR